jgi:hypothetical protein
LQLTAIIAIKFERGRTVLAAFLLAEAIVFAACFPVNECYDRYDAPTPPADVKATDYAAWINVCDWVAANTPPDALFLTPRLGLSFKWRTGRPEVVNRKDIPQDASGIVEWRDRLKDIYTTKFGGVDQSVDSLGALGTERVIELAKKYHAQYVLSDRGQLLGLPIAF